VFLAQVPNIIRQPLEDRKQTHLQIHRLNYVFYFFPQMGLQFLSVNNALPAKRHIVVSPVSRFVNCLGRRKTTVQEALIQRPCAQLNGWSTPIEP